MTSINPYSNNVSTIRTIEEKAREIQNAQAETNHQEQEEIQQTQTETQSANEAAETARSNTLGLSTSMDFESGTEEVAVGNNIDVTA